MRYAARLLCTVLSLSTMPAAANVSHTVGDTRSCHQLHTYVNQAYCVGATATTFTTDEEVEDAYGSDD